MDSSKFLLRLILPGRAIVKKNTARKFGSGRRSRVVYTEKYQTWEAEALREIHKLCLGATLDFPLEARFVFYFKNRHAEADVSNLVEGPQDLLKTARVISDDRIIRRIVAEKVFGYEPRTEIELWTYTAKMAA